MLPSSPLPSHRHQRRTRLLRQSLGMLVCVILLILAGCEAQATPVPAVLPPTPTLTAVPTLPPPVRYAFTANTEGFVAELDTIQNLALVEQLKDNTTDASVVEAYDLIATFGLVEGWEQAPVTLHLALIVNPALAPLDNALIVDTLKRSLNPSTVMEEYGFVGASAEPLTPTDTIRLRTDLANGGLPDGADLVLAHRVLPGYEQIADQLNASNLRVTLQPIDQDAILDTITRRRAHLVFGAWTTPEERAAWVEQVGEANVIDLYAIPISYHAVSDLTLEFTVDGFPIGMRQP